MIIIYLSQAVLKDEFLKWNFLKDFISNISTVMEEVQWQGCLRAFCQWFLFKKRCRPWQQPLVLSCSAPRAKKSCFWPGVYALLCLAEHLSSLNHPGSIPTSFHFILKREIIQFKAGRDNPDTLAQHSEFSFWWKWSTDLTDVLWEDRVKKSELWI